MMSDEPFPYIITPVSKLKPIDLTKQVNYRAGWHNNYKAPYFIKQPRFKKRNLTVPCRLKGGYNCPSCQD